MCLSTIFSTPYFSIVPEITGNKWRHFVSFVILNQADWPRNKDELCQTGTAVFMSGKMISNFRSNLFLTEVLHNQ